MTYPVLFRRKVLSVREEEGLTIAQVAKRLDVGVSTVLRWLKNIHPQPLNRGMRKINLADLAQNVREHPELYLHERALIFRTSAVSIFHALKKLRVTYKKNPFPSRGRRKRTAHLPEKDTGV